MYEGGIGTMNYSISNNAEYGEYVSGPKVIDDGVRRRMKEILYRIQSGEYAKEFVLENRAGAPVLLSRRRMTAELPIEKVGARLREMMPWIRKNRLVDTSKN
jgi:ketol-acid reductoisomerase